MGGLWGSTVHFGEEIAQRNVEVAANEVEGANGNVGLSCFYTSNVDPRVGVELHLGTLILDP